MNGGPDSWFGVELASRHKIKFRFTTQLLWAHGGVDDVSNPVAADDVGLDGLGIVYRECAILLVNCQAMTEKRLCGILLNGFVRVVSI